MRGVVELRSRLAALAGVLLAAAACGGRSRTTGTARGEVKGEANGGTSGNEPAPGMAGAQAAPLPPHWGEPLGCNDYTLAHQYDAYDIVFATPSERMTKIFVRDDGSVLGLRSDRATLVGLDGAVEDISLGDLFEALGSEVTTYDANPLGRVVLLGNAFEQVVLDLDTRTPQYFVPPAGTSFGAGMLSTSGRTLVGLVTSDSDSGDTAFVWALDGGIPAKLPAPPGASLVTASDEALVWRTNTELIGVGFDGKDRFRVDLGSMIENVVVQAQDDGDLLVGLGDAVHWVQPRYMGSGARTPLGPPATALALAPGQFGIVAAGIPNNAYVMTRFNASPCFVMYVDQIAMADINSDATFVIAGIGNDGNAGVELLTQSCGLLYSCKRPPELPLRAVRFTPRGDNLLLLFEDRLKLVHVPER